ncbi:hypothetical protein GM418_04755 [Maribellus comscasis]|uniref:Uncharacterized protein n=1 Tax=Maribellus comscasis TaxID=2681766 RepID=A0A6I6JKY5_9BACT|nr:hypothetical protein [Maribellus comscasis]QGY42991.1 hypothetical protein GM418_04755 [Maribellus comscasis]
MKKLITSIFILMLGLTTFAQIPQRLNYQAVLRDAGGQVIANQDVEISIAILQGSGTGNEVFSETHSATTNSLGLVNLQIGSVNTTGMENIDWSSGPYFIQISVDGTVMGTSQLLSVPYALVAGSVAGGDNDNDPENEIQTLDFQNNQLSISQGNSIDLSPVLGLLDTSTTNELQDISLSGTELSISQGSSVNLSALQDGTGTDNQTLQLYNNRYLDISNGNSVTLPYVINESDPVFGKWDKSTGITITESQISDLKHFTGDSITGNETAFDGWDKDASDDFTTADEKDPIYAADSAFIKTGVQSWNNSLAKNITEADTTRWGQDSDSTNELQALSISNDTIYLSNSDYVKLPLATTLADADKDTKIQVEESPDEDMLRVDIAGNETLTMSNSTGTILRLPTNDDNSSLKVSKNNGTVVFGVDGQGLLNGDGSGLSNVKSLLGYSGGDYRKQVTSTDPYNPTLMKTVEITVDGPGKVLIQATGYADWESTGCDYYRLSALPDNIQTGSVSFGNKYFDYLMIDTDKGCQDSSDQYSPLAYSRVFNVGSAGTYTYNLWADRVFSSSLVEMGDINMQAIYFPTGGTGSATLKSAEIREAEENKEPFDRSLPRNIDGSYSAIQADNEYEIKSPPLGELETPKIINQQQEERIKELEKKLELLLQEKLE